MALRLERVPLRSLRGAAGLLILLVLLAAVLVLPIVQLVSYVRNGEAASSDGVRLTAAALAFELAISWVLFALLPLAYVRAVRPGESAHRHLGLAVRPRTPLDLLWGALAAVACVVGLLALALALFRFGLLPEQESQLLGDLARIVKAQPAFILLISLTAGVTEEILFRGLLQPRIGLLASSVLFGLTHLGYGTVLQVVGPFLLSLVFGVLYRRMGTLWIPVSAHAVFDVIQLGLLYLTPEQAAPAVFASGIGYF